jgi:DHA2 family multidrug resistance protein
VFFINLPIGLLAFGGVFFFLAEKKSAVQKRFDVLGFCSLALAIGAFQLMLDRGPGQDWFGATEIWVYLIVGGLALWIFGVQLATANKPFVDRALLATPTSSPAAPSASSSASCSTAPWPCCRR